MFSNEFKEKIKTILMRHDYICHGAITNIFDLKDIHNLDDYEIKSNENKKTDIYDTFNISKILKLEIDINDLLMSITQCDKIYNVYKNNSDYKTKKININDTYNKCYFIQNISNTFVAYYDDDIYINILNVINKFKLTAVSVNNIECIKLNIKHNLLRIITDLNYNYILIQIGNYYRNIVKFLKINVDKYSIIILSIRLIPFILCKYAHDYYLIFNNGYIMKITDEFDEFINSLIQSEYTFYKTITNRRQICDINLIIENIKYKKITTILNTYITCITSLSTIGTIHVYDLILQLKCMKIIVYKSMNNNISIHIDYKHVHYNTSSLTIIAQKINDLSQCIYIILQNYKKHIKNLHRNKYIIKPGLFASGLNVICIYTYNIGKNIQKKITYGSIEIYSSQYNNNIFDNTQYDNFCNVFFPIHQLKNTKYRQIWNKSSYKIYIPIHYNDSSNVLNTFYLLTYSNDDIYVYSYTIDEITYKIEKPTFFKHLEHTEYDIFDEFFRKHYKQINKILDITIDIFKYNNNLIYEFCELIIKKEVKYIDKYINIICDMYVDRVLFNICDLVSDIYCTNIRYITNITEFNESYSHPLGIEHITFTEIIDNKLIMNNTFTLLNKQYTIGYKLGKLDNIPCSIKIGIYDDSFVIFDFVHNKYRTNKCVVLSIKPIIMCNNSYKTVEIDNTCMICYEITTHIFIPCMHTICLQCYYNYIKINTTFNFCYICKKSIHNICKLSMSPIDNEMSIDTAYSCVYHNDTQYTLCDEITIHDFNCNNKLIVDTYTHTLNIMCENGIHFHLLEQDIYKWIEFIHVNL